MVDDGRGKRDATTIRTRVWIAAGALIAPAAAVLVTWQAPVVTPASAAPPPLRSKAATLASRNTATAPSAVSLSAPSALAPNLANARAAAATRAEFASATSSASSSAARARVDSRLASDLRILEDEAARRVGAASDRADDDARRAEAADAFLADFFVQDAYRGTDFPIGYPAAQRTRDAAISRVTALDPVQRSAQLEVALQKDAEERIEPRFESPESGLYWEAALR